MRVWLIIASLAAIASLLPLDATRASADRCSERAERVRAAIQTDVRKRQIAEGVAKDLLPQVEKAETLCKGGKVSDGEKALDAITRKFGYR